LQHGKPFIYGRSGDAAKLTSISTSGEAFERHPVHGTTRDNLCTVK
jgi:hypothetical protein